MPNLSSPGAKGGKTQVSKSIIAVMTVVSGFDIQTFVLGHFPLK